MVTNPNGISAQLFGPWMRSENTGSLLFINLPETEEGEERRERAKKGKKVLQYMAQETDQSYLHESQIVQKREEKTSPNEEFQNVLGRCNELAALNVTLKRQALGSEMALQRVVLNMVNNSNFDLNQLATWASNLIWQVGAAKSKERQGLNGLDPDFLAYVGLGSNPFSKPHGIKGNGREEKGQSTFRKRAAPCTLENSPKRNLRDCEYIQGDAEVQSGTSEGEVRLNEVTITFERCLAIERLDGETKEQTDRQGEESPQAVLCPGPGADEATGRPRSWKRDARRSTNRERNRDRDEGSTSQGQAPRRHLDF